MKPSPLASAVLGRPLFIPWWWALFALALGIVGGAVGVFIADTKGIVERNERHNAEIRDAKVIINALKVRCAI